MHITIKADLFCAAARFTSNEETRYYLNGVCFKPHPHDGLILVAMDGHRLFAAHDETAEAIDLPEAGVIIKPPKQKMPAKWWKGETITLRDGQAFLDYNHATGLFVDVAPASPIDQEYPEWRRVVPGKVTGDLEGAFYNPRYLMDLQEVGERLGGQQSMGFDIGHNGHGPALIRFQNRDDCVGALMPIRASHLNAADEPPDWINARPGVASLAAE